MGKAYNFEVVAEIREDLTAKQKADLNAYINHWANVYSLTKENGRYHKSGTVKSQKDDFAPVAVFFSILRDYKQLFYKLEYYDYTCIPVDITKG